MPIERLTPVYRLAVAAQDRKDEVKLSSAIAKLCEEDPSLVFEQNPETHDLILAGQGEVHLKVAVEKLQSRYGLALATRPARVPYRESIRKPASVRGRHKRQTGGHGQFGDVVLEIAPAGRGGGFTFHDHSNNAMQTPHLPDWAVVNINERGDRQQPLAAKAAGFFDEAWKVK